MYYFPNFDSKLNYQLYLLIYGERKTHWYDDIIPKIQQFIQALHYELKDYKCPYLLITLAGFITFILCGIIIKILGNLYRSSPDQYHNLQNLQLTEVRSSESIERDEEFISNSDIVSERSDPVIKQEINEILENFQAIEQVSEEGPCIKECIFEGYKKVFVLTISMNDLPSTIVDKLNILNDPDCAKCHPMDEIQPIILEIIDKILAQVTDKCDDCIDNISNESQTITSIIQNGDNQEEVMNKCTENLCRGQKSQSGSKIPLSLKSRQQRQFIKNINDP